MNRLASGHGPSGSCRAGARFVSIWGWLGSFRRGGQRVVQLRAGLTSDWRAALWRASSMFDLRLPLNALLLGYATCHPRAASAQGGRMICMIVSAGMNHQGMALDVDELEPGRQYRIVRVTRRVHEQRRQIS